MYLDNYIKSKPSVNVISQETFKARVAEVFGELGDILGRSFGPYGAPTIISMYPYMHATKDGFTIAKNLVYSKNETTLDAAIHRMAMDICGRLNNTVGDGTTTAIIATNEIYKAFNENFSDNKVIPRDVMKAIETVKDLAVEQLRYCAESIQSDDPVELGKNIRNVVYISSNGDEQYTDMIGSIYEELKVPAITVEKSVDGETRCEIIEGYQAPVCINDLLYINTDNETMVENSLDVLVFNVSVTEEIYNSIIKPLWTVSHNLLGRKLLIVATNYDVRALDKVIARDINNEWNRYHSSSLILTTIKNTSSMLKKKLYDLAMLLNTTVIDRDVAKSIMEGDVTEGQSILKRVNITDRNIPNIFTLNDDSVKVVSVPDGKYLMHDNDDFVIRAGYVDRVEIGKKNGVFKGFYYDEARYQKHLEEAKKDVEEAVNKYSKLGTFNLEIPMAQSRYYALTMKLATISVGADSELNQQMVVDSVDDAVKAAASAFNNGIVSGCNTTLIASLAGIAWFRPIEESQCPVSVDLVRTVARIMARGFMKVQYKVLTNAFPPNDKLFTIDDIGTDAFDNAFRETFGIGYDEVFDDEDDWKVRKKVKDLYDHIYDYGADDRVVSVHDVIIAYAVSTYEVFDVTTKRFTDSVVNSVETDIEVMKSVSDLISILINGNQMIIATYGGNNQ